MADHALRWPPTRIAGRCLSAYFFGRDEGHAIQRVRSNGRERHGGAAGLGVLDERSDDEAR